MITLIAIVVEFCHSIMEKRERRKKIKEVQGYEVVPIEIHMNQFSSISDFHFLCFFSLSLLLLYIRLHVWNQFWNLHIGHESPIHSHTILMEDVITLCSSNFQTCQWLSQSLTGHILFFFFLISSLCSTPPFSACCQISDLLSIISMGC